MSSDQLGSLARLRGLDSILLLVVVLSEVERLAINSKLLESFDSLGALAEV